MNLTGQIIVSMPSLEDERFYKTVIYIMLHKNKLKVLYFTYIF